jgi:alkanesulfonate monooxygenase
MTAAAGDRPATLDYLCQIVRAAEQLGFAGALTPTGAWCEDAWLTTAMLAARTEKLKFLVAFRPGLVSPTLAAQMAATFQRHSRGRLLLNVVTAGEDHEQRAYGDFLDKDERYRRTDEFLGVVRDLRRGESVTFEGKYLSVAEARLAFVPDPVPPVYFGGSSVAAIDVAARQVDVYLTWGEPPAAVERKITAVREAAERQGRTLRFGIRLHVISRDTSAQALGPGAAAARRTRSGHDRLRTGRPGAQRLRGPATDAGTARRPHRRAGDLPEPVGGRGPGARGSGHRARRQPRRGR